MQACFKLGMWPQSLLDAERAIEMDGSCLRAHYRKGLALVELGCLADALGALEDGLRTEPKNEQMRRTVRQLQAKIRDSFRAGRAVQVEEARVAFHTKVEERLFVEGIEKERDERRQKERREDLQKWKLDAEAQQR